MSYEFYLFNHFDKKSLPKMRDFVIVYTLLCRGVLVNSLNQILFVYMSDY